MKFYQLIKIEQKDFKITSTCFKTFEGMSTTTTTNKIINIDIYSSKEVDENFLKIK